MKINSTDLADMTVLLDTLADKTDVAILREGTFETSQSIDVAVKFNEDSDEYELEIL